MTPSCQGWQFATLWYFPISKSGNPLPARYHKRSSSAAALSPRARTFLHFARYHQNMVEFFDIGNHLELAGRILARPQFEPGERLPAFNVETNKAVYLAANGGVHRAEAPTRNSRIKV